MSTFENVHHSYEDALRNLQEVKECELRRKIKILDDQIEKNRKERERRQKSKKRRFFSKIRRLGGGAYSAASKSTALSQEEEERQVLITTLRKLKTRKELEKILFHTDHENLKKYRKILNVSSFQWQWSPRYLQIVKSFHQFSTPQNNLIPFPTVYGSFVNTQSNDSTIYVLGDLKTFYGTSLMDFVMSQSIGTNFWVKLNVILKALEGLRALHEKKFLHGDVNGQNILVLSTGVFGPANSRECKVVFGPPFETWKTWDSSNPLYSEKKKKRYYEEDVRYRDPMRIFSKSKYLPNKSSDIFSFGCMLYSFIFQKLPDPEFGWFQTDLSFILKEFVGLSEPKEIELEFSKLMEELREVMMGGELEEPISFGKGKKRIGFEEMYLQSIQYLADSECNNKDHQTTAASKERKKYETTVRVYKTFMESISTRSYFPLLGPPKFRKKLDLAPYVKQLVSVLPEFLSGDVDRRNLEYLFDRIHDIFRDGLQENWNLTEEAEFVRKGIQLCSSFKNKKKKDLFYHEHWKNWTNEMMIDWMRCSSFSDTNLFSIYEEHVEELRNYLQREELKNIQFGLTEKNYFAMHRKELEFQINFLRKYCSDKKWRYDFNGLQNVLKKFKSLSTAKNMYIRSLSDILRLAFPSYLMSFYLDPRRNADFQDAMERWRTENPNLELDEETIVKEITQTKLETDARLLNLSVKVVVTETGADGFFQKMTERIGGFITNMLPNKMRPRFGFFHTGVVIGSWKFDWNTSSLTWPATVLSGSAFMAYDVGLDENSENIVAFESKKKTFGDLCFELANLVCEWNRKKEYDMRTCNCQNFVKSLLDNIGYVYDGNALEKMRKRLGSGVRIEKKGNLIVYKMERDYAKWFGMEDDLVQTFETHLQFDVFVVKLKRTNKPKFEEFKVEKLLLKSIDRAFWLRHYKNRKEEKYKPLKNPMNQNICFCPFQDPKKSNTYSGFVERKDLKKLREMKKNFVKEENSKENSFYWMKKEKEVKKKEGEQSESEKELPSVKNLSEGVLIPGLPGLFGEGIQEVGNSKKNKEKGKEKMNVVHLIGGNEHYLEEECEGEFEEVENSIISEKKE